VCINWILEENNHFAVIKRNWDWNAQWKQAVLTCEFICNFNYKSCYVGLRPFCMHYLRNWYTGTNTLRKPTAYIFKSSDYIPPKRCKVCTKSEGITSQTTTVLTFKAVRNLNIIINATETATKSPFPEYYQSVDNAIPKGLRQWVNLQWSADWDRYSGKLWMHSGNSDVLWT
jgi:hypothetical protein